VSRGKNMPEKRKLGVQDESKKIVEGIDPRHNGGCYDGSLGEDETADKEHREKEDNHQGINESDAAMTALMAVP